VRISKSSWSCLEHVAQQMLKQHRKSDEDVEVVVAKKEKVRAERKLERLQKDAESDARIKAHADQDERQNRSWHASGGLHRAEKDKH